MIQRIQTLYLLLCILVLSLMIFLPVAEIVTGEGRTLLAGSTGLVTEEENVQMVVPGYPLLVLLVVLVILLVICVLMYKNRKLQLRISIYTIILEFGLIGLMYYYWVMVSREIEIVSYLLKITVVFPLITIILNYLAFRGIRKDELLIRSLNRLR